MSGPVCQSCGNPIQTCEYCSGKICAADCPDRLEDGCTCAGEEDDDEE